MAGKNYRAAVRIFRSILQVQDQLLPHFKRYGISHLGCTKRYYDYTAVLGAIKAGKETEITILRAKKKVELKITPTRRK